MPPHTEKQCVLPVFCWLTSQHLIAERKKRANLISWEELEDGGAERCQWLSSSKSTHTHDNNPHPVLANYYSTISSSAFLSTAIQEFHLPLSSFSSLLYLFPSWSSSLSVLAHTEHILVFLPDCAWLIYLCVFAHIGLRGFISTHVHSCVRMIIWIMYQCVGGVSGPLAAACMLS